MLFLIPIIIGMMEVQFSFTHDEEFLKVRLNFNIDFFTKYNSKIGSIHIIKNEDFVADIQHVRRRETVAITP